MKKIQVMALSAVAVFGAILTSCGGKVSTSATLSNEIDTVSYAQGVSMAQQGLSMHLQQLGLYTDTASMRAAHVAELSSITDETLKADKEKAFKNRIDSATKANTANLDEFLLGIQEAINASKSKDAYYAGIAVGNSLTSQMLPGLVARLYGDDAKVDENFNKSVFMAGFAAAAYNQKIDLENASTIIDSKMATAQEKIRAKQAEELKTKFADKIAEGKKFFDENKSKDGVVALPSGLQYKVLKEGNGEKPTASDIVKVHYHGTLIDGTVFDSSVERKEPATFNVGGVIPGWTEALQQMTVGSKWIVYIPAELAYNEQQRGEKITPFSPLVFEVELLAIEKQAEQPQIQIQ